MPPITWRPVDRSENIMTGESMSDRRGLVRVNKRVTRALKQLE